MSTDVSNDLDRDRIVAMRKKIIQLERENVATQTHNYRTMVNKLSEIIKEEALRRY